MAGTREGNRVTKMAEALCAAVALLAVAGPAAGQLPCSYTVTALPDVNCGILGYTPGNPVAINNLGHAVLTAGCSLSGYDDSWLWTGGSTLTLIPKAPGMLSFTARDLNDNDVICGEADMTGTGRRAAIYDHGTWTILPPLNPPTGWSNAWGINNSNQVCGWRSIGSPTDPINPTTAFFWSATTGIIDLGLVNGQATGASAINQYGAMTGGMRVGGVIHPFIWRIGQPLIDLGSIGNQETTANDINSPGRVAGSDFQITSAPPNWIIVGFRSSSSGLEPLLPLPGDAVCGVAALSDAGFAVGLSRSSPDGGIERGCVWVNATPYDVTQYLAGAPNVTIGRIMDISGNGRMLAWGFQTSNVKAFVLAPMVPAGDIDGDCRVNINDLLNVINQWGTAGSIADLDHDGTVNINDLLIVISNWSSG